MADNNYQKFKLVNQIIINYLNLNYPQWNTHAELGFKADAFLLSSFLKNYHHFDSEDLNASQVLQNVYINISSRYAKFKQENMLEFNNYANTSFFKNCTENYTSDSINILNLEKKYFEYIETLKRDIVFVPEGYTMRTQLN